MSSKYEKCVNVLIVSNIFRKINVNVQTEQGIKDELIIAVFIQNIRELVGEYYALNLSRDVTVYNYVTTILEVEKLDGGNNINCRNRASKSSKNLTIFRCLFLEKSGF